MSGHLTLGPTPPDPSDLPAVVQAPEPPAAFAPEPEEEAGLDWRRYAAAVMRYKWIILVVTALGTAGGVIAAQFSKPQYEAQATIWVETIDRGSEEGGPIRSGQLLAGTGWVELLKSFVVLDAVVEELRLYLALEDPADSAAFDSFRLMDRFRPGQYRLTLDGSGTTVTLATKVGTVVETASPGDSIGVSLGFAWVPNPTALFPGQTIEFSVSAPRDAALGLFDGLQAITAEQGNFLRVMYDGTDPKLITDVVNAVVRRFEDVAADLKRKKLTELADILEEQLRRSERNLRDAELSLESFRVRTITLPTGRATPVTPGLEFTRDPVMERYFNLKVTRDELSRDREGVLRALQEVRSSGRVSPDALEVIGEVQRSTAVTQALGELMERQAELRALKYRYTDEHPSVQRLTQQVQDLETSTVPMVVTALLDELNVRQSQIDSMINSASRELQQIPPRVIEEARLVRDVAVAENLYTLLQQRYEEARLAEASSIPDLRLLDPAVVPERPVTSWGRTFILIGMLSGLALSLFGAVIMDRVDRRVRYPTQVTSDMGLPMLGVVPRLKGSRNGAGSEQAAAVIEALRGVRLNLVHARGSTGPLALTISSPGPGEGKSFISSNLALAFAEAGHRTLLIDGDARRGTLHRAINCKRKPGLTDFLAGGLEVNDVIQETEYKSLSFIGCGTRTSEAPELLSSPTMSRFMAGLRSTYSVIIVDSPPLNAGVDAYSLGTLTGNMLMVLRLGATNRELAEAKLEVLDRLPIRVLGAVLNDVRGGGPNDYYRYYSYYLPGYEHDDEDEPEDREVLGQVG